MSLADLLKIKVQNHKMLLDTIRRYRELSAAQLSRISGYRRSTLVYILRRLQQAGLIEISRIGKATAQGGKPPTLWRLVAQRGYIVGLEIVPHKIRTTVIDFASQVIHQHIDALEEDLKTAGDISIIARFVSRKLSHLRLPRGKIIGLGVAMPGLIDHRRGMIHYSDAFGIENLLLGQLLQQKIALPTRIANDANAGALGLKWYPREGQGPPGNTVFLSINESYTGIGAGLILNGQLYEGSSGTAGEIVPFLPDIALLLEKGIRKYGISKLKLGTTDKSKVTMAEVSAGARQGCRVSRFVLRNISRVVVREIIRIIELINPDLIVIGGDFSTDPFIVNDYIKPQVEKECRKYFPVGITIPAILFSELGIYSVSMGATALILQEIFS